MVKMKIENLETAGERKKSFEDKVIRRDSISCPIPKEAFLWIYYFSNQALEEKESKYQGHSNALARFGLLHRDVNVFMALKEEEPMVKEVLEEFDLSENDLPFLIISPFKLNLGKESVPKDRIYVIKKWAFTDRLCDYNNALDFYRSLYEAQKEEKSLRTFILSEKFKDYLNEMRNGNPISKEEHEKIKKYCDKIEGRVALTMEEYEDFKELCRKMSEDIPEDRREDFDGVVAGLFDFIRGAMIGALLSRQLEYEKKTYAFF